MRRITFWNFQIRKKDAIFGLKQRVQHNTAPGCGAPGWRTHLKNGVKANMSSFIRAGKEFPPSKEHRFKLLGNQVITTDNI